MRTHNQVLVFVLLIPILLLSLRTGAQTEDDPLRTYRDSVQLLNRNMVTSDSQIAVQTRHLSSIRATVDSLLQQKKVSQRDYAAVGKRLDSIGKIFNQLDSLVRDRQATANILDTTIGKMKDVVSGLKDSVVSQQKSIAEQMATIAKQKDSLETIAEITMNDSLYVYMECEPGEKCKYEDNLRGKCGRRGSSTGFNGWRPGKRFRIQEVHIKVREGMVLEILVKTDVGCFRNSDFITNLVDFNSTKSGSHRLRYVNQRYRSGGDRMFVFLDDVFRYDPRHSYTDVPYADFDITLYNDTTGGKTYLLRESTSLNTYFNLSAFSDIKGISGDPNSIIQFVADAKFITNTRSFCCRSTVPFHFVSFQGGIAKFDNDYKGSPVLLRSGNLHDSVSRRDLLQRSHYYAGIKVNLLRGFESPRPWHLISGWQLNAGYNFIGSRVFDTTYRDAANTIIDTAFRNTTQNQFYLEPSITFSRHRNFSMTVRLPVYLTSVKQSAGIDNYHSETWAAPGLNLMYYGKSDERSRIFLRYNHFINLGDPTQAFSQIQLGFTVNITDVWSGK